MALLNLLPKSEATDRLRRIQSWMEQSSVDAVFVLQNADLFYFSGTVQAGLLCLPISGDPVYLIQKSLTRGRLESPLERLVSLPGLKKAPDILSGEGLGSLKRIGLEMDVLPASYYLRFQSLFPNGEFVDASDAIRKIRMVKSEYEVGEIRRAARMLERAFTEVPGWMEPGTTELELQGRLEGFLRQLGHQGITRMRGLNYEIAYGTVSSGPSASYPTCFPGPVGFVGLYPGIPNGGGMRKLAEGDPVMADIVGGYGGYIADKTRTYVLGDLPRDMRDAHEFILEIMGELRSMLRPGVPCAAIYRRALDRIGDSHYAANFMGIGDSQVRFVGHGVGLELNDWPVLAPGFDLPLEAGMTIAIEPKIFFPERGGVGIEDTYLITRNGPEKLTPFEENIIQVD
jgi:Xaa-Pro aminopeptidase